MSEKLVTAVITTYKRGVEIVERAIKSVVNQTYSNLEIIVVNDYPDDHELVEALLNIISQYNSQRNIEYVVVERNGGACKARNLALNQAKGDYIAFLDDDDEWLPNKIEKQVEALENNEQASLVYCNSYLFFQESNTKRIMFTQPQPEGQIFYDLIKENIIGSCTYPMFRVSSIRNVGGFGEYMPALQDWELYLRLLKNGSACYISEPLAVYYFYNGERISGHPERRTAAFELIQKEFCEEINQQGKGLYKSSFYLKGTYFYSMNNQLSKAIKAYIVAIKTDPVNIKRNVIELLKLIKRVFIKPNIY